MRCEQFETRLNDVLDRRSEPSRDRALAAHADECATCRSLLKTYAAMCSGLAELRSIPSTELKSAALRSPERRGIPAIAVAASLAACAVFGFVWNALQDDPVKNQADHSTTVAAVSPVEVVEPSPPAAPASRSIRPTTALLARQTGFIGGGLVVGTARGLDEAIALATTIPSPDELLAPVLFSEDGLWHRLENEILPAAGDKFDSLRNLLPTDDSQRS